MLDIFRLDLGGYSVVAEGKALRYVDDGVPSDVDLVRFNDAEWELFECLTQAYPEAFQWMSDTGKTSKKTRIALVSGCQQKLQLVGLDIEVLPHAQYRLAISWP